MTVTTEELRTQETIYRDINRELGEISEELAVQLGLQKAINNSTAATTSAAATAAGRDMQQYLQRLREGVAGSARFGSTSSSAWDSIGASSTRAGMEASSASSLILQKIEASMRATGKLVNKFIPDSMRNSFREIQMTWGGLGPNILKPANDQAKALMRLNEKALQQFRFTTNASLRVMGMDVDSVFATFAEASADFNYIIRNRGVDGITMLKTATDETVLSMGLYGKGLGLQADQLATFVSRSISLTGKASLDMLKETAAYSKSIERQTGISSKFIAQSIEGMIRNTERFGNVTVEEASRIAASLAQMNVGYKELDGLLGKFQGFESSAQSVSMLTSAFGVHLDAVKAMKLANTDQEAFLHYIRESMIQTGKAVEDMTLPEKRLIKDVLGFSDIESVERFLKDGMITPMEELAAATDSADVSTGLQQIMGDIQTLDDITQLSFSNMNSAIQEGLRAPFSAAAYDIEQDAIRVNRSLKTMAAGVEKEVFTGAASLMGIDKSTLVGRAEGMDKYAKSVGSLALEVTKISKDKDGLEALIAIGDKLGEVFDPEKLGKVLEDSMTAAFTAVAKQWHVTLDKMSHEKALEETDSPWLKAFGGSIAHSFDAVFGHVEKTWSKAIDVMSRDADRSAKTLSHTFSESATSALTKAMLTSADLAKGAFLTVDAMLSGVKDAVTTLHGLSKKEFKSLLKDQKGLMHQTAQMVGYEMELLGDMDEKSLARYKNYLQGRSGLTTDQVELMLDSAAAKTGKLQASLHEELGGAMQGLLGEFGGDFNQLMKELAMEGDAGFAQIAKMGGLGEGAEAITEAKTLMKQAFEEGGGEAFNTLTERFASARAAKMRFLQQPADTSAQERTGDVAQAGSKTLRGNTSAMHSLGAKIDGLGTTIGKLQAPEGDVVLKVGEATLGRIAKKYILNNPGGDIEGEIPVVHNL